MVKEAYLKKTHELPKGYSLSRKKVSKGAISMNGFNIP